MSFIVRVVLVVLAGSAAAGCGIEQDYVLREPLEVRFGEGRGEAVTLPAGTRVRRTFVKEDVAFITAYGTASRSRLAGAGGRRERAVGAAPVVREEP